MKPRDDALLVRLHEGHDGASGAGARGAAGAVQVVLRPVRRVEVNDEVDVVHVDATGGDVGCHQDAGMAGGEPGEGALPLYLAAREQLPPEVRLVWLASTDAELEAARGLGFDAERGILREAGVEFEELDGCCGLAGNFGFEQGHLAVSVAVADHAMLPALRRASAGTRVIADGFSCRTQADQLGADERGRGPRALHLAEVLASALPAGYLPRRTKRDTVPRRVQDQAMATLTGRKS